LIVNHKKDLFLGCRSILVDLGNQSLCILFNYLWSLVMICIFYTHTLLWLSGPDLRVCKQFNGVGPLQGMGLKKIIVQ